MSKDLVNEVSKQIVHTTSLFKMDNDFSDERFCKVRIAAMHSGINRNGSRFSKKCIENAKNTFKNIPILADIQEYEDENGEKYLDYSGHSMHIEEDKFDNENQRIIYDEKVVGVIPETNNFEMVYDEETGNWYAYVDALLYRDYGNYCCDILESRGGITDVSMEIGCDDISYSAKDKCLDVGVMTACATTLLGDSVTPGMTKAHAEMFSCNNRQEQLMTIMQELKESLDNYTNIIKKGGANEVENENIILEAAETTEETVIETESTEEEVTVETTEEATIEEEFTDDTEEVAPENTEEEVIKNENNEKTEEEVENQEYSVKGSISYGSSTREFAVSLSDIQYALSELVNTTYADEESYYGVEVYMEDKYVIMKDYWTGKAYKQSYKVKNNSYTLHGDRVSVKAVYLTEDEEKELDKMRSNYSSIQSQLADYQAKEETANKKALMSSDEYASISENAEFIKLKNSVDKEEDKLTYTELKEKADKIQLNAAKTGNLKFSTVEEKKTVNRSSLLVNNDSKTKADFGNLFEGIL